MAREEIPGNPYGATNCPVDRNGAQGNRVKTLVPLHGALLTLRGRVLPLRQASMM